MEDLQQQAARPEGRLVGEEELMPLVGGGVCVSRSTCVVAARAESFGVLRPEGRLVGEEELMPLVGAGVT